MSATTMHVTITRVAARFYTWDFQYGDHHVVGVGTKGGARFAFTKFKQATVPGGACDNRKVLV